MILSNNIKNISKVGSIEKIDDASYIVKYVDDLGEVVHVSVIPSEISDEEIDELFDIINNPEKVLTIPNRSGQVFHGYVQTSPINSVSCVEFNKNLLEYLNKLYKYIEFFRYQIYSSCNGKLSEEDQEQLKLLQDLEVQSQKILKYNSESIAPIWRGESVDRAYGGTALSDIYYITTTEPEANSRRIMEYCLASGVMEMHGLYDYGAYGGPISYSFMCQLFGVKAAESYSNNSFEGSIEKKEADKLHGNKKPIWLTEI